MSRAIISDSPHRKNGPLGKIFPPSFFTFSHSCTFFERHLHSSWRCGGSALIVFQAIDFIYQKKVLDLLLRFQTTSSKEKSHWRTMSARHRSTSQ